MSGTRWTFVVTATEEISGFLTDLDIPLDDETADPNVSELADLAWLSDHDLIGEALIVGYEYVGSYVSIDMIVFDSIRDLLVRWSQPDSAAEALL